MLIGADVPLGVAAPARNIDSPASQLVPGMEKVALKIA
jgi:hypothetical protein